ncbi:MAG: PD40 domain-containing protein [Acidobacteria bacterium]|nr:PD40 domain-containing protein [Acidobacteriota bacterium]
MIQTVRHFYEFGPYRLDITERILLRQGQHVPLPPKALETLLVLVEHGGHILEKEELLKRIWPDTFVEEGNLAKKISDLRKVLSEEQAEQYIETIPKRGYRFVVPVNEVWGDQHETDTTTSRPTVCVNGDAEISANHLPLKEQIETSSFPAAVRPEIQPQPTSFINKHWRGLLLWLTVGLMAGVVIWWMVFRAEVKQVAVPLKIVPFTSFPSSETQAAFSPDGNQIAFVWDGEKGENLDIYVRLIGAGQPLRLTTNAAADTLPAWSPDGRFIAFLRQSAESSAIYLVPALGGAEQKIAEVFPYRLPALGSSPYYSPDGKFLAIADKTSQEEPFSIYLLSTETGEKRPLTAPASGTVGDSYPAFSPDGKTLAFIRSTSISTTDIYLMNWSGGAPHRLTFDNTSIQGLAWDSDGRNLVFASRRGGSLFNLWQIPATGGTPERLPTIGQSVLSPAISRQGNRLAYTQTLDDSNIHRLELDSLGKGKVSESLVASTMAENGPDYSPDGQKIVFASCRSGDFGIWICDRNGGNIMQLVDRGPHLTGTPHWSPDGRWIVYDSRSNDLEQAGNADIYIISAEGGQPRRLTTEPSEDVTPSWSRDGQWIYFCSSRSGSMQIWKVPAAGGEALQVTRYGGFEACESTDGKILYYSKGRSVPGIWQVPVAGGEESLTLDYHKAGYWRLWTVMEKGIYFATATTPSRPVIEFYNFATRKVTTVATLDKPISRYDPGLAISPDRRSLLFTQMDQSGSDIMLVDNFQPQP